MKKILAAILALMLALSLVACGGEKQTEDTQDTVDTQDTQDTQENIDGVVKYTLGMGMVTDTESSKEGTAQVDSTIAAVVMDADGKIVLCRIDAIQNKMTVTDGAVDTEATYLTKMEKGDDYNMKKFAEDCNIEWYDQVKALEAYVVGMTAAEVEGIETRVRGEDEPHPGYVVAADEALFAQCSITITDFKEAIVKAMKDDQAKEFEAAGQITMGVAAKSTGAESTAATADAVGSVKMYSDIAAVVMDADGKVLAAISDAIQPKIGITTTGAIDEETTAFKATKRELKEDYNMVKFAEDCNIEWYQQSANFTNYIAGMTKAEVEGIETRTRGEDEAHPGYVVAADADLFAQCSIQITGMKEVIATAIDYAR